jgi:hypothetical protein
MGNPRSLQKVLCIVSLSAEERRAGPREECSGPAPIRWRQNLTLQMRHTTSALGCIFSLNRRCIFVRKARAPTRRPIPRTAYSYRVWITPNKLLYAPLWYLKIKLDIHQGESLCGRLLPSVRRVSEKNSSETV